MILINFNPKANRFIFNSHSARLKSLLKIEEFLLTFNGVKLTNRFSTVRILSTIRLSVFFYRPLRPDLRVLPCYSVTLQSIIDYRTNREQCQCRFYGERTADERNQQQWANTVRRCADRVWWIMDGDFGGENFAKRAETASGIGGFTGTMDRHRNDGTSWRRWTCHLHTSRLLFFCRDAATLSRVQSCFKGPKAQTRPRRESRDDGRP